MAKAKKPIQHNKPVSIEPMLWTPGQGPDMARLQALEARFPKPVEPLGEAWFMSEERKMFDDLNAGGIEAVSSAKVLREYIDELLSGLVCFPTVREWPQWYAYFLSRLLDSNIYKGLGWADALYQGLLLLSLMYPEDTVTQHEADFASVLVPWIMDGEFWEGHQCLPLYEKYGLYDRYGMCDINFYISESLLIAWRYLPSHSLHDWLHSVLTIKDIRWRAHLIIWLVRVSPLFVQRQATLPALRECDFDSVWRDADQLLRIGKNKPRPEIENWRFIPDTNIMALREAINKEFGTRLYFEWIDLFSHRADIWPQMELWMTRFQDFYLQPKCEQSTI